MVWSLRPSFSEARARGPIPQLNLAAFITAMWLSTPAMATDPATITFEVPEDVVVELIAREPVVVDPVAIAFSPDGSMWVVELRDYPHGPPMGKPFLSKIKHVFDRNGDGIFDEARVFVENVPFITGLLPWKDGLIVTTGGEVAFYADRDGDGTAEIHETWIRGFAQQNPQLRANRPTLGLDGKIYVANGLRGGEIESLLGKKSDAPLPLKSMDLRFDVNTGAIEPLPGVAQFGLTFDEAGHRFTCDNRHPCQQVMYSSNDLSLNPAYPIPLVMADVAASGDASRIFPISTFWTTSNLHEGQFTACCGLTLFEGTGLPERYYGAALTCDPTGNLVHAESVTRSAGPMLGKPTESGREFLATKSGWVRPVNLAAGPDGALYVVDMHRAVIEHPEFMPEELKNRPDLRDGDTEGRIYRVRSKSGVPAIGASVSPFKTQTTAGLVSLLDHPNRWHRDTAARLLWEQSPPDAIPLLTQRLRSKPAGHGSVRAMWMLERRGQLEESLWQLAIRSDDINLVDNALVILGERPEIGVIPDAVFDRWKASNLRLRLTLAIGRQQESAGRIARLRSLAVQPLDSWLRSSIVLAAHDLEAGLLSELLRQPIDQAVAADAGNTQQRLLLLQDLAMLAIQRDEMAGAALVGQAMEVGRFDDRAATIHGLGLGTQRARRSWTNFVQQHAAANPAKLAAFYSDAMKRLGDASAPLPQRIIAARVIRWSTEKGWPVVCAQTALALADPVVRQECFDSCATLRHPEMPNTLLAGYSKQPPAARRQILDVVLTAGGAAKLYDTINSGSLAVAEIDSTRAKRLIDALPANQREEAKKKLQGDLASRADILASYESSLSLKGSATAGKVVFEKNCATCHRVGPVGVNVGADISDTRTKTPKDLLTSILDPNRAVDANFFAYSVALQDGRTFTGIIKAETASSITLRQPEGKEQSFLREEIEEIRGTGQSLMPVGLEKAVSPAQMADLIEYLKSWRYLEGTIPFSK